MTPKFIKKGTFLSENILRKMTSQIMRLLRLENKENGNSVDNTNVIDNNNVDSNNVDTLFGIFYLLD